jgi:predicted polyphosphate/ATP-dependent NAD kinase
MLKGASSFKKINEIEVVCNNHKLIATIEQSYRRAPYFAEVIPILSNILMNEETNLARYLTASLNAIIEYLGIQVSILISSEIEKDNTLKGDEKVIAICKNLKATNYINAIGGQELYSKNKFAENSLILNFIKTKPFVYKQFKDPFIPWLSIVDVMMFNSREAINEMLNEYELV